MNHDLYLPRYPPDEAAKPDARSGSYGIGRANHASRSPLPDSQGLTSLPRRFLTSSPPL